MVCFLFLTDHMVNKLLNGVASAFSRKNNGNPKDVISFSPEGTITAVCDSD